MKKSVCVICALLVCLFAAAVQAEMEIHFLDVGEADAAIVVCDGEVMVVDAGEAGSGQFLYAYLRQTLNVEQVEHVVMTHPHDDHIGGIPTVLKACKVNHLYSPMDDYPGERFQKVIKAANEQGLAITVPAYGDEFRVGSARCKVVSPIQTSVHVNDLSLALLIEYGDTRFLLTGDMEKAAEEVLLNTWEDIHADVLKVAHHGRDTSSTHMFLRVVNADHYVVSGGAQLASQVKERLEASGTLYTTAEQGTIICRSDGEDISFSFTKTTSAGTVKHHEEDGDVFFVGNRNSKKLHCSWCDSVSTMSEKNKVIFQTKQEALDNGYTGCARCTP